MRALGRLVERLLRHQRTFRRSRQRSSRGHQPVIVAAAVRADPDRWIPIVEELIQNYPTDSEEDIAWRLIERVGTDASKLLLPVYEESKGVKGHLCLQVNPKFYRSAEQMLAHGIKLASLARI